jgi:regulator of protease activity HflC (stomatin/prohibitin superfamily)
MMSIRDPGPTFLIPFIDSMQLVDLRIQALDIPKQETLTKDNISTFLNAVVYYKITDPRSAILNVQNYANAIYQHGQAAIRDIAGSVELDTLLCDREKVALEIQKVVAQETKSWGIEVVSINIQDLELPAKLRQKETREQLS